MLYAIIDEFIVKYLFAIYLGNLEILLNNIKRKKDSYARM